jgi:hypothetical protein
MRREHRDELAVMLARAGDGEMAHLVDPLAQRRAGREAGVCGGREGQGARRSRAMRMPSQAAAPMMAMPKIS